MKIQFLGLLPIILLIIWCVGVDICGPGTDSKKVFLAGFIMVSFVALVIGGVIWAIVSIIL